MTLEDALIDVLRPTADLFLKTWHCHWNVTGPNAASLHTLFGEQYAALYEATDTLAEQVRALGEKVPPDFVEMGVVGVGKGVRADAMISALLEDHTNIMDPINTAIEAAQEVNDQGTLNLLADRAQAHAKMAWMLRMLLE